jgi:hypothetical protein
MAGKYLIYRDNLININKRLIAVKLINKDVFLYGVSRIPAWATSKFSAIFINRNIRRWSLW